MFSSLGFLGSVVRTVLEHPTIFFFLFLGASLFSTSYSILLLDSNAFKYKIKRLEFILFIFVSLFFGAYLLYIPPHAMSLS